MTTGASHSPHGNFHSISKARRRPSVRGRGNIDFYVPSASATRNYMVHVSQHPYQACRRGHSHERDPSSDQDHHGDHATNDGALVLCQERLYLAYTTRVWIGVDVIPPRKRARTWWVVRVITVLRKALRAKAGSRWYRNELEPCSIERSAL